MRVNLCFFLFLIGSFAYGNPIPNTQTPIKLNVELAPGSKVVLYWTDASKGLIRGYNVYTRESAKSKFFKLNSKIVKRRQFSIIMVPRSGFSFLVKEVLGEAPLKESAASNEVRVSSAGLPVFKPDQQPKANGMIDIIKAAGVAKWEDPGKANLTGYNAYWSDRQDGVFILANSIPFGKKLGPLKGLEAGKKYFLTFTSVSKNGKESKPSKLITTNAEPIPDSDTSSN
jgi:hypothetical protein